MEKTKKVVKKPQVVEQPKVEVKQPQTEAVVEQPVVETPKMESKPQPKKKIVEKKQFTKNNENYTFTHRPRKQKPRMGKRHFRSR